MRAIGSLLTLLGLLLLLPAMRCQAQTANFATWENDTWFKTDRYYTNAVQFSARSREDTRGEGVRRWTDGACRLFGCGDARFLFTQHSIGQLMYTPADITLRTSQLFDRPWAGLLYAERQWLFLAPDEASITTLAAQAGVTGRLSLAEPAQKMFHRLFDRPTPQGWDHQVGNTLALLVSAERRSAWPMLSGALAGDLRLHTAGHWRLAAGNLMSYAALGLSVTIGKHLPLVAPAPPGIVNRVGPLDTACRLRWVQCTLVLGAEGRFMAYNLFLQGRPWRDDPGVKPHRWVGELSAGLRLDFPGTRSRAHGPWFAQLRAIRRSAEFRGQAEDQPHTVSSLTLGVDF
ncbi:lipid A deacylase LpxR family protein [Massilia sp. IC2-477]|uniref:lipid A deacylase LpxR family protein n=1 Tax=Massilia sp. IC2-477 TaxID=2887198 RepID=UPI001D123123|nr:lipid A deacylase LpxR family protein [Massilia sp. IC2-477]MCC2954704.1 lipid A deacylase LpxR family protein [Massilia sp. IC2-477]